MTEFMLLIRNEIDHQDAWPEEQHQLFLKKCEDYITRLQASGRLIAAQPMVREGAMISGKKGDWRIGPFHDKKEVIVGYYHILAANMNEAVAIAKDNPEFEYGDTARVEVRPIKTAEKTTGYTYPEHKQ